MRFLFTCIPGFGHFHPIVPLARALIAAGHDVAIVTAPAFAPAVTRAGLEAIPAGLNWDESRLLGTQPELCDIAAEYQGEWLMQTIFLDRSPRRMVPDLLKIIPAWRPDAILSGTFEFGGPLAAELLGVPHVSCSISIRWDRWILDRIVGRPIAALRREFGLPPDPKLGAFGRFLDLCFVPPSWTLTQALLRPALTRTVWGRVVKSDLSLGQRGLGAKALLLQRLLALNQRLRPGQAEAGATTHFIGQALGEGDAPPPPEWLARMPRRPTVYVSLGTVFSGQYPDVFARILEGLRDEPINLIVTMGGTVDPARFGPQPENVRIERFITQDVLRTLLPHVDLCINHAGYSSVMEASIRGIPLLLLPLTADQPVIAQMCYENGVAVDLPAPAWRLSAKGLPIIRPDRLTPAIVRDAARRGLDDPAYCAAARALQARMAALPGLDKAVALLERLVAV